jgi:hypothetical protein
MGGGYAPLAYRVEGGIDLENSHVIFRGLGAYDDGHKVNDNDQPNPKGRDRYLQVDAYYRFRSSWFVGAGWRWDRLSTTNYAKGGNRPEFGGGYDLVMRACAECRRDFSMRVSADWVMGGTDWENGSHGPSITITLPTPRERRHVFFRETLDVYRFHTTVTEPDNVPLTLLQRSERQTTSYLNFGVIYRF